MSKILEYSSSLKRTDRCLIKCTVESIKCQKIVEIAVQAATDNIKRNNGKFICRACCTFFRTEKEYAEKVEEKKKLIDSKLQDILLQREIKPLSGETKTCSDKKHDIASRNTIPRYPYLKDSVPVEDFYNENDPNNPYTLCLGCRIYRSQCLQVTNTKRKEDSDVPGCKTCLANCHSTASTVPRENIPLKYFLQDIDDPDSKIGDKCLDCRQHIKNVETKRIEGIAERGGIFCGDCKVEKTVEEMALNQDGVTMTKCKICKQRDVDHWLQRYDDLKKYYRQIQLNRIIEKECSCEVCKCIFLKPNEGEFICVKLETRNENGINVVDYEGKTYSVKEFLTEYSNLLEYRILDFDHLPSDDPLMKKSFEVCVTKKKEKMFSESLKCQLTDCECHVRETIKREKGTVYKTPGITEKKEYVDNIKRAGCSFCHYIPENNEMLRFIHMDHIDPSTKIQTICKMVYSSEYCMEDLHEETPKCRPLCAFCHRILTNYFFGSSYVEFYTSVILDPVEIILN